jgi:hypothetical protein
MPSCSSLAQCPAKRTSPFQIASQITLQSTRVLQKHPTHFVAGHDWGLVRLRMPWTRCPFCSTSTPEETGPGVSSRPSHLQRGVDL